MVYYVFLIFSGILISCQQQIPLDKKLEFQISYFHDGEIFSSTMKTITTENPKLDIFFFKQYFNKFYGIPKFLTKQAYQGQKVSKWALEDNPKDWDHNWIDTYQYDSKGRIIEYTYSGCGICSNLPWGYKLKYDKNNQVSEQEIYRQILPKPYLENDSLKTDYVISGEIVKRVVLKYNQKGNINKLEQYEYGEIRETIELINP